jgi:hypothetical protein
VDVSIARVQHRAHRASAARFRRAHGTRHWTLRLTHALPAGRYRITVRALGEGKRVARMTKEVSVR